MDKETWQYFKAQHQSIDNRKKSIMEAQEQKSNVIVDFCKGLYEMF